MNATRRSVEVLVIGSGAGGAVTALELASRGRDVLMVEAGGRPPLSAYGKDGSEAMKLLYRGRGMTPLVGPVSIGFVEGQTLGGSTEINSGFWHRTPRETLQRWKATWGLDGASPDELAPHFDWAEAQLGVHTIGREKWPRGTQKFADGIEAMSWSYQEVPRAAPGCQWRNACANGCPTGSKQGMSRKIIPAAEAAGARVVTGCAVQQLLVRGDRVEGCIAMLTRADGRRELIRIDAEHVFVCAGPTQSAALLRRSGLTFHVGDTLHVHPMLKVAAVFDDEVDAEHTPLPMLQVKQFWPEISMGGAFVTAGHLAMHLSDNWPAFHDRMALRRNIATYYVAVRGTGRGSVRPSMFGDSVALNYALQREELANLSKGMARLTMLLLAAGAREVLPGVQGLDAIRTEVEAARWLDDVLPRGAVSLTTVHAFSSVPAGERLERCAVDSYGRVHDMKNVYVSDASILPDSPGVNPQGSVMAFARRNAIAFAERVAARTERSAVAGVG